MLVRSATYKQLGLLTYFTSGEKETRAWTIKEGFTAPQAAGVIHTGEGCLQGAPEACLRGTPKCSLQACVAPLDALFRPPSSAVTCRPLAVES